MGVVWPTSELSWAVLPRCAHEPYLQDPKQRPISKYLQQHKFVVGARQSNAPTLLPLVRKSRDMLAQIGQDSPIDLVGQRWASMHVQALVVWPTYIPTMMLYTSITMLAL